MGWLRGDDTDHEGFAVALVTRDDCGSGLYRELQYPQDCEPRDDIQVVQAGCCCGWRSPFLRVRGTRTAPTLAGAVQTARYSPYITILEERDEDRLRELWNEHVEHCVQTRGVKR